MSECRGDSMEKGKIKMSMRSVFLFVLVCIAILISGCTSTSNSVSEDTLEHKILENLQLVVDGKQAVTVRTFHYSYENNRFVSIRDLAFGMSGSERKFNLTILDGILNIYTNEQYEPVGGEDTPFSEQGTFRTDSYKRVQMTFDGAERRYYGFFGFNSEGKQDCFLNLTDLAMMMDLSLKILDGILYIDTSGHYEYELQEASFFDTHAAIVGDADTGEIFASWEPDTSVPIASTTKLMTYIIVMDSVEKGLVTLDDMVTITKEAEIMSRSDDGEIEMTAGTLIPLKELLYGMLLPSSNECAYSLAVHVAGSEAAFVKMMHQKAVDLGLSDKVRFFNCHGLPTFTEGAFTTKLQNRMTASDMFKVVRHIMATYPQITNITSVKSIHLDALDATVKNTNPLLYNVPEVVGLKTGTTDMARNCLVALMRTEGRDGKVHNLVAIQFGAEDESVRISFSEQLIRYAKQRLLSK